MPNNYRSTTLLEEAAKFDPHAHAVTVIAEQHRLIHDGMFFQASGKQLSESPRPSPQ